MRALLCLAVVLGTAGVEAQTREEASAAKQAAIDVWDELLAFESEIVGAGNQFAGLSDHWKMVQGTFPNPTTGVRNKIHDKMERWDDLKAQHIALGSPQLHMGSFDTASEYLEDVWADYGHTSWRLG